MTTSKWQQRFKVHPAAGLFPIMSDEELAKLGEDIKANGLQVPLQFWRDVLIDGRNRLEAMERAGVPLPEPCGVPIKEDADPVAHIISANIRRRHLTKQQQAELIVAAHAAAKPRHHGEVSKGGRGKKDDVKSAVVASAKEVGVSKRTVERVMGKKTKAKPKCKPKSKPKLEAHASVNAARRRYLEQCEGPEVDLDREQDIVIDALREIASKRALTCPSGGSAAVSP
jgi:hypothetical protein